MDTFEPNIESFERYTKTVKKMSKDASKSSPSYEETVERELHRLLLKAERAATKDQFGRREETLVSVDDAMKVPRLPSEAIERLYSHFGVSRSKVVQPGAIMDTPYDGKTKEDRLKIAGNHLEKDGVSWQWDHNGEINRVETQTENGISLVEEWRKVLKGGLPTGDTIPVQADRLEHVISFRRQPMRALGTLAVEGPLPDPHDY
jgi:hypothetical protein